MSSKGPNGSYVTPDVVMSSFKARIESRCHKTKVAIISLVSPTTDRSVTSNITNAAKLNQILTGKWIVNGEINFSMFVCHLRHPHGPLIKSSTDPLFDRVEELET